MSISCGCWCSLRYQQFLFSCASPPLWPVDRSASEWQPGPLFRRFSHHIAPISTRNKWGKYFVITLTKAVLTKIRRSKNNNALPFQMYFYDFSVLNWTCMYVLRNILTINDDDEDFMIQSSHRFGLVLRRQNYLNPVWPACGFRLRWRSTFDRSGSHPTSQTG